MHCVRTAPCVRSSNAASHAQRCSTQPACTLQPPHSSGTAVPWPLARDRKAARNGAARRALQRLPPQRTTGERARCGLAPPAQWPPACATKPTLSQAAHASAGGGTACTAPPLTQLTDRPWRRRECCCAARTARACVARCLRPVWPRRRRAAAARSRAAQPMMPPRAARWATCTRRVCSRGRTPRLPDGRQLLLACPRRCAPSTAQPAMAQATSYHCASPSHSGARAPQRNHYVTRLGPLVCLRTRACGASSGLRLRWLPCARVPPCADASPRFQPLPPPAAVSFVTVWLREPSRRRWATRARCSCCARPALQRCLTTHTPASLTRRPQRAAIWAPISSTAAFLPSWAACTRSPRSCSTATSCPARCRLCRRGSRC